MSVGSQLGLDGETDLLDQVRRSWRTWIEESPRLGVVEEFEDLRGWLRRADRAAADEVLLELAMRAAPDGGDDVVAAAALAKCLLPGACVLACWLLMSQTRASQRDRHPLFDTWSHHDGIDEVVASQLWIECRSFPWRRRTKVAANVMAETRVGVLRELGAFGYLDRVDRTWARTAPVEALSFGDLTGCGGDGWADGERPPTERDVSALGHRPMLTADPSGPGFPLDGPSGPAEELAEVLDWACETGVIAPADRRLLMCLVQEAEHIHTRNLGRGFGGLVGNEVSIKAAPALGISEATVRRHTSRTVRALAAAAPGNFSHGQ